MIKIICVGKIKEKYYIDAINEYLKRLSKYTKIDLIEVKDEDFDDKDYVITLEIEGEELDSISLSKKIENIQLNNPNITFIIGGSYGLHEDIKKRSNYKLSFSKLTFPHQLFRVILLEQLYRSYKIINNETYHK